MYSLEGKAKLSAAIIPVFSVTWSFRIHSNMLNLVLKKHFIITVENSYQLSHGTFIRILRWTEFFSLKWMNIFVTLDHKTSHKGPFLKLLNK